MNFFVRIMIAAKSDNSKHTLSFLVTSLALADLFKEIFQLKDQMGSFWPAEFDFAPFESFIEAISPYFRFTEDKEVEFVEEGPSFINHLV